MGKISFFRHHYKVKALGETPRTLVYLQNSGFQNGDTFNSSVLSCQGTRDDVESLVRHATNFIARTYQSNPIRWSDIHTKTILHPENYEGEHIGNQIRDRCFMIDDIQFQGGHIYGGKTGDLNVQLPSLKGNHLPMKMDNKYTITMASCRFNGKHICDIENRKGSVAEIRSYQHIILNMMMKREFEKWLPSTHKKKTLILEELGRIQKDVDLFGTNSH